MDDSVEDGGGDGEVAEDDSARTERAASQSALPASLVQFLASIKK